MICKLYSVKDKLIGFTGPIAFRDDKVALRWFESFCKAKKETEYTDPKYYELYCVGTFDDTDGQTTGSTKAEMELIKEGEAFNEPKN